MKKRFIPLLSLLMVLASCSQKSYAGTYSFSLGNANSTHIGIYLNLTDEVADDDTKKFNLKFDIGRDNSNNINLTDEEIDELNSLYAKGIEFDGKYSIDESDPKAKDKRVYLSVNLLEKVLDEDYINVPSNFVEKFLYATISDDTLTLDFPVSFSDLLYQLYWYGYRVDIENKTAEILEESHDVGTTPTSEDIAKIITYEESREVKSDFYINYRAFHLLEMGLTKEN